ncbi:MAG: 3-oxoacyl-ACP synthase [Flavobacteriaceae bacterium]|nr:3-oxoacyl-ACP synthase [Flavobacteriaceae bacterium]
MDNTYFISDFCHITAEEVSVNGTVILKNETAGFETFLKEVYQAIDLKYSKFFKMDTLSKLTFLGAELLLKKEGSDVENWKETALVFSNKSSSLETDRKHQQSIEDSENFYPSPAVFVYTLPNIGMGEVAIRHQLQTDNAFFVFDEFEPEFLQKYTVSLLQEKKCSQILCGWTEVDGVSRHGFFYVVSQHGTTLHTKQNIKNIYTQS